MGTELTTETLIPVREIGIRTSAALASYDEQRRRLATHLFDSAVQDLVAVSQRVQAVDRSWRLDTPLAHRELMNAMRINRSLQADLREIVYDLYPPTVEKDGLLLSLDTVLLTVGRRFPHLDLEFTCPSELPELGWVEEVTLYRVLQLGLAICCTCAPGASRVGLQLRSLHTAVELAIEHNDPTAMGPSSFNRQLSDLYQALELTAGVAGLTVRHTARAGGGSTLIASLPVVSEGQAGDQLSENDCLTEFVGQIEAERSLWALELHDTVLQLLAGLSLRLGSLERQVVTQADPEADVADALVTINLARQELDRLSNQLYPSRLADLGLVAAMRWLVDQLKAALPELTIRQEYHGEVDHLGTTLETVLFRITQEAFANVRKHAAGVTLLQLCVTCQQRDVTLQITDDGPGFELPPVNQLKQRGHFGLAGMAARAALLDGTLAVDSSSSGVTLTATVPRVRAPH